MLVVLPCTKSKAFRGDESLPAAKAYIGQMFLKGQSFAVKYKLDYIILSARYGWLRPEECISNYEQTFLRTPPDYLYLTRQAQEKGITSDVFIVLGGSTYSTVVRRCFPEAQVIEPLKGLALGYKLQRLGNQDELLRQIAAHN